MNSGRSPQDPPPGSARRPPPPVVHSITAAAQAHSDDQDARIRRYLFSMGLRTICVILVLVIDHPVRWVFAVLAVILPYIAVVMANAVGGRRRTPAGPAPVVRLALPEGGPTITSPSKSDMRSDASSERTN